MHFFVGGVKAIGQASASGTSDENLQPPQKRVKIESSGDSLFDLNLPAEAHQANP